MKWKPPRRPKMASTGRACGKRALLAALVLAAACAGCDRTLESADRHPADLPQIKRRGVLRVLTAFSSTGYFVYRGRTMGFEHELLARLAEHLDLRLEVIPVRDIDSLIILLAAGEGDLVAYNLTVTAERAAQVAFAEPLTSTHQVLVQRKPELWRRMDPRVLESCLIRAPDSLAGRTVHVRHGSAYYERLVELAGEIAGAVDIEIVDGRVPTEELIRRVAAGDITYTVSDQNLAHIIAADYPNLDVGTAVGPPQQIAWAVSKSSPLLLAALNTWLRQFKRTPDYYAVYNKYYRNRKAFRQRPVGAWATVESDRLSPYDGLIRRHAAEIGWDWRLLAAVIYEESQFDPEAESQAGAAGLMQLLPSTAAHFGVIGDDIFDPARSIAAGAAYLDFLERQFSDVPDTVERLKFALAAYNAGAARVQEARRLAERYGEDVRFWTDIVEDYLRLRADSPAVEDETLRFGYLRSAETADFVRDVFARYEHYCRRMPSATGDQAQTETLSAPR
ncbi:MAG TPA: transporter substrate-binding domain-containing protein [candidate division Zixibacteria bacterium]|nr:transporter substrate-binding domain-containing protein [candidate division Zixibacteria bacterium]MDD4916333.1 transporter substrate-binding domain-containing protein [candidate division Zixibacteria bacterium]MDM7971849.1 transporter substrate-binding domain-containing protein [candidate division Zixibacteria bacterium]HOD66377.1 transporter substrate-binding domain-containing protein [candidate division Zixibacteria bacterium]HOZ07192.1 transporter substrate-binding domain-containing prot